MVFTDPGPLSSNTQFAMSKLAPGCTMSPPPALPLTMQRSRRSVAPGFDLNADLAPVGDGHATHEDVAAP